MSLDELWEEYNKTRNIELRNKLIENYVEIVQKVVNSMIKGKNLSSIRDDLNSVGVLGLIDAVKKYNIKKNVTFETYASIRIRGAVKDYMRKQDNVSRGIREKKKKIDNTKRIFQQTSSKNPTDKEISNKSGLSEHEIRDTLTQVAQSEVISMENEIGEGIRFADIISSTDYDPEKYIEELEVTNILAKGIETLKEREQKIIALYYNEELKLKEIGSIMDISEGRVSQIIKKCIIKLKEYIDKSYENKF